MKTLIITMVMGLNMALATAAAFASGGERHDSRNHDEQYESKVYGTIKSLPNGAIGTWNVNGRDVVVTNSTFIKEKHGKAEVGAYVEVEGMSSGNALTARKIEVKRSGR